MKHYPYHQWAEYITTTTTSSKVDEGTVKEGSGGGGGGTNVVCSLLLLPSVRHVYEMVPSLHKYKWRLEEVGCSMQRGNVSLLVRGTNDLRSIINITQPLELHSLFVTSNIRENVFPILAKVRGERVVHYLKDNGGIAIPFEKIPSSYLYL